MPPAPPEVAMIYGGEGDDVLIANEAIADALNGPDTVWNNMVMGYGGNDVVLRDRTGDYDLDGGEYDAVYIYGGTGVDTLSYMWLSTGVVADLTFGGVWQTLPANAPAWQVPYAVDRVFEFEHFIATAHDDVVAGSSISETIHGHDGEDTLSGGGGNDTLWGGQHDDMLDGGSGNDLLQGDSGHDEIVGGSGNDTVYGGDGNDVIEGGIGNDTIYGNDGNDVIDGGSNDDVIYAGDGFDDIKGGSGNDTIYLDDGDDTVDGGSGNDVIHVTGFGDHVINGGVNSGTVVYSGGSTTVDLNAGFAIRADGFDLISGVEHVRTGSSNDTITGTNSANVIKAGSGNDVVLGLNGNDEIHGENGNDNIDGGYGNDTLLGGSGVDRLFGGSGNDSIDGASGADRLRGGSGADTISGGSSADVFEWKVGDSGLDILPDFHLAEDKLSFGPGFFADGPMSEVLEAYGNDYGTALWAETAWGGWQQIAWLQDVDAAAVNQKIANGSIFHVETVFETRPGGLFDHDPGFESAQSEDFLF